MGTQTDQVSVVTGGFEEPIHDAQRVFHAVMQALARPGTVHSIEPCADAPTPIYPATAALLQMLADADSPVWLDHAANTATVKGWIGFHTGAPMADTHGEAAFAVVSDAAKLPPLSMFALGTQEYPDRSTTLIIQVESLTEGAAMRLRGPGIKSVADIRVSKLPTGFEAQWAENNGLFPRGVDVILAAPHALVGLPRTTRLDMAEVA